VFAEQRLDCADDSGLPADFDAIAHLERPHVVQMAGRHHLVAAPKLISIPDPRQRSSGRYASSPPKPIVVSVGPVVEMFRVGVEDAFQFVQAFDRLGDVLFSEFLDESF
jgi:hypothetical protein